LVVASTPWTVENEILTPTFKIKRNRIEELYAASYDGWESSGKKVIW
jgi:long-chain acyl-CoA synthetase